MPTHTYLDQGLSIFHTRLATPGAQSHAPFTYPHRPFLTISREACAGATTLGWQLVTLLNEQSNEDGRPWIFLDKDLLTRALTTHHLPEQLADFLPEDRISEFKGLIGEIVGLHPPLGELEQRVTEAILQIAQLGCVIFAGRAAHLVTRNLPGGFHLRLVAPRESRIARMQELQACDRTTTEAAIQKADDARRRFVRARFDEDIDDPHTYDLIINTACIPPGAVAQLVLQAMQQRIVANTPTRSG